MIALACAAGLIAVWVVYPAVVGVIAFVRPHPVPEPPAEWPPVSVVVATREPPAAIRERVRNLLETQYPLDRIEIVIAYDRNAPEPAIEVPPGVRLRMVPGDEPGGKAASLNAAMRNATASVVLFADTCQRWVQGTIPNLVSPLMSNGTGAVTGGYMLSPGTGRVVSLYWSFERWLRRAEACVHSSVGATGAVYAIRRECWKPLPPGLILDDVYTPMNIVLAGQRVAVADGALAIETRTPTPRQEYGRKVRTLTGVIQLCAWLPAVLVPFRNPIWVQFMFHKVLRLLTPYFVLGIGVWALLRLGERLDPLALAAVTAAVVGLSIWLALSDGRAGARLRRIVVEALLIQVAVLVAGINGLRGHWSVWDA